MAIIYAFGDSITYGAWDIEKSGWAARLRKHLDDMQERDPNFYALFYNLGIPGETTNGFIARFEIEYKSRLRDGEKAIFIFAYGANDAAYLTEESQFKVPIVTFKENLESMIASAKKISPDILVVNILPVVEAKNKEPRNGKVRLNSYIGQYNMVMAEVVKNAGISLVDVNSAFMQAGHERLFIEEDGLHPNTAGHELLYETIKRHLVNLIAREAIKKQ